MHTKKSPRILRLPDVLELTGLGRSLVYALMREGDFPKSIKLSARAVGWPEVEILGWIEQKKNEARP